MSGRRARVGRLERAAPPLRPRRTPGGTTDGGRRDYRRRKENAWWGALVLVLASMPEDRAAAVHAELRDYAGPDRRALGAISRRALALADSTVPPSDTSECERGPDCHCEHHFRPEGRHGPLALPEAVCRALDSHPDARFTYVNCRHCAYQIPTLSDEARRRIAVETGTWPSIEASSLLDRCPLCGGHVGWLAYEREHPEPHDPNDPDDR